MRLILIRHGETKWNQERRIVGHTQIGLNETGRRQAERLAWELREQGVSAIYSSPLRRAYQTAEAIARYHGLDVVVEDALKEFDAGDMNGLKIDEVYRDHGDFFNRWMEGEPDLKMPGGESVNELKRRAWPLIERILRKHRGETVIAVSHTITILTIINQALGMTLSNFRKLRLNIGSISILDFNDNGVSLLRFNDTCHWRLMEDGSQDG